MHLIFLLATNIINDASDSLASTVATATLAAMLIPPLNEALTLSP